MRPTIVLFDLDGTLVVTGGAGRRALARAYQDLFGRPDALEGVPLGGMTDYRIVRTGLRAIGRPDDPVAIEELIACYLGHLPGEIQCSRGYRVLPGVERVVEATLAQRHFAVGLGTGNVRPGAEAKLARGGLNQAFSFGGFGCDHEERAELLRAGIERGAAKLHVDAGECRVVVVGDTPRDVSAALAIGAECVGVGTGGVLPAELIRLGAVAAFDSLDSPLAVEAILCSAE